MADEDVYGERPSAAEVDATVSVLCLAVDRYVKNRARRTTVENAKDDPEKPMCRWMVEPDACDFCKSRGDFLFSPDKAPNESHSGCKCHPKQVYLTIKQRLKALQTEIEDSSVRRYLRSDKQPKGIVHSKYLQHCRESKAYANIAKHSKYPPSYLTISEEECERLVVRYAGTGELSYNSNWRHSKDKNINELIINHDSVVGVVVNNKTGAFVETSVFKIHYSSEGAHIVPDYPSKKLGHRRKRD